MTDVKADEEVEVVIYDAVEGAVDDGSGAVRHLKGDAGGHQFRCSGGAAFCGARRDASRVAPIGGLFTRELHGERRGAVRCREERGGSDAPRSRGVEVA